MKINKQPKYVTGSSALNRYCSVFANRPFKYGLIGFWVVSLLIGGWQLPHLKPDFEFEKLFPADDPDVAFYNEHRNTFGYDNDFLMILLGSDEIFSPQFQAKLVGFSQKLAELGGTIRVHSLATIRKPVFTPTGVLPIPLIHPQDVSKRDSDSTQIMNHPAFSELIGEHKRSTAVHVIHTHFRSPEAGNDYIREINHLASAMGLAKVQLVGKLTAQNEFIRLIQSDFGLFTLAGLFISFVVLMFIYRKWIIAIIPFVISITTLIWILGLMSYWRMPVTIFTSLVPPILLFVSTMDAIHLINAFAAQVGSENRLLSSIKKVFLPTLLTSLTTAIGFLSLWTLDTEPIWQFGVITALGVALAFLATYLFAPLIMGDIRLVKTPSALDRHIKPFTVWLLHKKRVVCGLSTLIFLLGLLGAAQLKTDAYLLADLPDDSPVKMAFLQTESEFGGYKPWEIAIWPADSSVKITDKAFLEELMRLEEYLAQDFGLLGIRSIGRLVALLQHQSKATNEAFTQVSKISHQDLKKLKWLMQVDASVQNTVDITNNYARVTGFIPEWGSMHTQEKNKKISTYIKEHVDDKILKSKITGTTFLIDKSHHWLSQNLIQGLFAALLFVSVLLMLYFKSMRLLLILLTVNVLPLIVTAGIMASLGISLTLTTSILFTITFGIVVDDSIHFISVYMQAKSHSPVYNLLHTYRLSGKSIIITSLVLMAGFGLFIFSSFNATIYLGIFLCVSMLTALIIDLCLLPLLLIRKKTTY